MSQSDTQFKVRLPADVKDWLEKQASKNMRSKSAELLVVIKTRMKSDETQKGEVPA